MNRDTALRIYGVLLLLSSVLIVSDAIREYVDNLKYRDWTKTTAVVTHVDSWSERVTKEKWRHGTTHTRTYTETYYDVEYTYEVEGVAYTDLKKDTKQRRVVGNRITIQYDPDVPKRSVIFIRPPIFRMLFRFSGAAAIGTVGFFLSGLRAWCRSRRANQK